MSRAHTGELRDTLFVESGRGNSPIDRVEFTIGEVVAATQITDSVRLEIRSFGEGLLLIASNWSPYWIAEVDGRTRDLIRANHAQMALRTKPGEKTVKLTYRPPYSFGRLNRISGWSASP